MEVNSMHDYILGRDVRNGELVTVQRDGSHINMMANGWTGSGKTYCFVNDLLLQSMTFGESVLVTADFYEEIFNTACKVADQYGYSVRTLTGSCHNGTDISSFYDELKQDKTILIMQNKQEETVQILENLFERILAGKTTRQINVLLDNHSNCGKIHNLPLLLSHDLPNVNVFIAEQVLDTIKKLYGEKQAEQIRAEQDAVMFFGGAHNVQERRDCESFLGIGLVAQAGGGMCADIPNRKALLDMSLMGKRQAVVKISNRQTVLVNTVSYREMYRLLANGCKH